MELIINGNRLEVPDTVTTVSVLLKHFELDQKVVIVEKNAEIIAKEEHQASELCEGDKIELVHFVGGG